jgi:hypothetical protein
MNIRWNQADNDMGFRIVATGRDVEDQPVRALDVLWRNQQLESVPLHSIPKKSRAMASSSGLPRNGTEH